MKRQSALASHTPCLSPGPSENHPDRFLALPCSDLDRPLSQPRLPTKDDVFTRKSRRVKLTDELASDEPESSFECIQADLVLPVSHLSMW